MLDIALIRGFGGLSACMLHRPMHSALRVGLWALFAGALAACRRSATVDGNAATSRASSASPALAAQAHLVKTSELCISTGRIEPAAQSLRVDSGGMRAVVGGDGSSAAELDFAYVGPSHQTVPLASGELRRQIGIKLRAKDTCNVVYVMWHVEPTPGVAVSVKHNPGASTHAQCGDRGYIHLRPEASSPVPPLVPNERHRLRAEIDGNALRVLVDGRSVWMAKLPPQTFTFDGPAGIRSDNGIFDFDFRVDRPPVAGARCPTQ